MADEDEYEESGGSGRGLMLALIALVLILLIAVGVGGYLLYSNGSFSDQPAAPVEGGAPQAQQEVKKANDYSGDMGPTVNVAIEDLILNITTAKGREKLMKLSFTLKCAYEGCASLVEQVKPEIQDAVISQTSARSAEELFTVGGKALFKEELLDEINAIINEETKTNEDVRRNIMRQLYFTTFVIK